MGISAGRERGPHRHAGRRRLPARPAAGANPRQPVAVAVAVAVASDRALTLPIRVRAWDGSSVGPVDAPTFVIRHRRALRRLLWKPGEMGLVRAYVAGELDIEGDIFAALGVVQRVMWNGNDPIRLSSEDKSEIVRTAVTLGAVGPEPAPPPEEFAASKTPALAGTPPVPLGENAEFAALVLGPSMMYGCAMWPPGTGPADLSGLAAPPAGLEAAQRAAHEAVARRLGLRPGMRVLDLSCGWGSFVVHAAAEYGVRAVGLTRSQTQAEYARDRAARADLGEAVEIRVGGHDSAPGGPYDAVVELGVIGRPDLIAGDLHGLLVPGGRLLVRQMLRRPGLHSPSLTFTTGYVFPGDGELLPLGELVTGLEEACLEVREVRALREDYGLTLRAWAANLQQHWAESAGLVSPGRARVWLLYLAAAALACENGLVGVHELCAVRRNSESAAAVPAMSRTLPIRQ